MDVSFDREGPSKRLVCTLQADDREVVVTASDAPSAGANVLAALDDVRATGYGECFWPEVAGDYRWMFRRTGEPLTVVVLWSSGTLTGWQHVLRAETDFDRFVARVWDGLTKIGAVEREEGNHGV